jgi:hypothetical protein
MWPSFPPAPPRSCLVGYRSQRRPGSEGFAEHRAFVALGIVSCHKVNMLVAKAKLQSGHGQDSGTLQSLTVSPGDHEQVKVTTPRIGLQPRAA